LVRNALNAHADLPDFYWTGETNLMYNIEVALSATCSQRDGEQQKEVKYAVHLK